MVVTKGLPGINNTLTSIHYTIFNMICGFCCFQNRYTLLLQVSPLVVVFVLTLIGIFLIRDHPFKLQLRQK